jgi:hypothetical protein
LFSNSRSLEKLWQSTVLYILIIAGCCIQTLT